MPTIPSGSIDAIITDLPYGTTACKWDTIIPFDPMWKEVKRVLKPNGAFITTASQPFTSALIMSNPSWFKYEWIWDKVAVTNPMSAKYQPMRCHENIVVFYKKVKYNPQMRVGKMWSRAGKKEHKAKTLVIDLLKNNGNDKSNMKYPKSIIVFGNADKTQIKHPTQKPVALYEYLIRTYTNEGETVLDIAMGSGTTIESAERTGRNSIGIEKDEGIFQAAVLRLKSLTPSNNRLHLTGGTVPAQGDLFTPEDLPSEGKLPAPAPRR